MASRPEVEVTISTAKDLKNVNWRHGPNKPYAIVWVDPNQKPSTKVDKDGDTCPHWNETLVVPLPGPVIDEDTTLHIEIVHFGDEVDTKKLIGSARLKLVDVREEVGFGELLKRSLTLKRPSGRPQGKVDVKVIIRKPSYHPPPAAYYAPPSGVPQPPAADSRDYGYPYGQQPPPSGGYPYYQTAPPPSGYPSNAYNAAPPPMAASSYSAPPPMAASSYSYGQKPYGDQGAGYYGGQQEKKKSDKFGGMGAGLAVGAVAGILGGIALAEGFDALEDKIADDAAEKVERDYGDDGDFF